jgi:hypothetical protein
LSETIEFAGKSGARYRYMTLDETRFLPPAGANYVIAQRTGQARTIVLAGETDNLAVRAWQDRLEEAKGRYGDVEVLTRLNVKSAVRREELADMIDGHQPPMNVDDKGPSANSARQGDQPSP